MFKSICLKCDGKGHIKAFSHVLGGVCYSCSGIGYKVLKKKPSEKQDFVLCVKVRGTWITTRSFKASNLKQALKHKIFTGAKSESKFIMSLEDSEKYYDDIYHIHSKYPYSNDYTPKDSDSINAICQPYHERFLKSLDSI